MKKAKRIKAFVIAVLISLAVMLPDLGMVMTAKADEGVTLKLHYHREDGDYSGWDVWFWPEGGEGAGYPFEDEDGEMVATMDVKSGTTRVGFIVRTQDWEKDIESDQYIDISEVISGTVHAYVESGVEGAKKEYGDDVVTGTKLKSANYNGDKTVTVLFTGELQPEQEKTFYVIGRLGEIAVTDVKLSEKKSDSEYYYEFTIADELDSSRNYRLGFEDGEYKINMPIIYSTKEFEDKYTYEGNDLGVTYSKEKTAFRVWAPTAEAVYLNLYDSGNPWEEDLKEKVEMTADANGTWVAEVEGDIAGTYYTYTAILDGLNVEACDPYARTCGVNGKRAMVVDLEATNPDGWNEDTNPHAGENMTDAVIYELHVRDFSVSESGGIEDAGKYTAFTKAGTKTEGGNSTGIDYLKDLGVTHIHILPFYDFGSVDENAPTTEQFNWGYDPVNYNVPEGSYSTDPYHGEVRVAEAKQMVKALHDNGLSVVMDVVYNHVYSGQDFCVNRLVPGYFSRINEDGTWSNGSGCGNDTASERTMVRKYIVDSVCYWADEYHIDGFRFDLVGLIDVDTINEIVTEVHKTHPDVIFYGEGWSMNTDVTKEDVILATQQSSARTPDFAYFNDNMRDGLKGSVFNTAETGWVSGSVGKERKMISSFMAEETWSKEPAQIVQYASCHDNNTLFDRIATARINIDNDTRIKMSNLAAAYYLTAEGIPFMQAGEEILRTKVKEDGTYESNSFSSGDEINCIKWEKLDDPEYKANLEFYKGLIAFRKEHGLLRLTSSEEVAKRVVPVEGLDNNVIAFNMDNTDKAVAGENAESIFLIFNPNEEETTVQLPEGEWNICANGISAGTTSIGTASGSITVAPISEVILTKGDSTITIAETKDDAKQTDNAGTELSDDSAASDHTSSTGIINPGMIAGTAAVIATAAALVIYFFRRKK